MKPDPAGLPALTRWRVLARGADACHLALEPVTGRTHQLRVHCAAAGFPIRGDAVYGAAARGADLLLHARAPGAGVSGGPAWSDADLAELALAVAP